MFPGQGSQVVGMGRDLSQRFPEALAVFNEVDDALGDSLSATVFGGPMDVLGRTANTQPALLAHGVAAYRAAKAYGLGGDGVPFGAAMGHSVGEYTALVAIGALDLAGGARLLRARGLLMEVAASEAASGCRSYVADDRPRHSMLALLLKPMRRGDSASTSSFLRNAYETAQSACQDALTEGGPGATADVAAINSPRQIVLSGSTPVVTAAADALIKAGIAARAVRLNVTTPFHSSVMKAAGEAMAALLGCSKEPLLARSERLLMKAEDLVRQYGFGAAFLQHARLNKPTIPFISNVTAAAEHDPERIANLLCDGIWQPVRWYDCVMTCLDDLQITRFVEFGPGATLCGLVDQCGVGRVSCVPTCIDMSTVNSILGQRASPGPD